MFHLYDTSRETLLPKDLVVPAFSARRWYGERAHSPRFTESTHIPMRSAPSGAVDAKTALKEKSVFFRVMNRIINPLFNRVRDSIVTETDITEARKIAGESG